MLFLFCYVGFFPVFVVFVVVFQGITIVTPARQRVERFSIEPNCLTDWQTNIAIASLSFVSCIISIFPTYNLQRVLQKLNPVSSWL